MELSHLAINSVFVLSGTAFFIASISARDGPHAVNDAAIATAVTNIPAFDKVRLYAVERDLSPKDFKPEG